MTGEPAKDDLQRRLSGLRADLLSKVEGVSDLDARRPLTPSGTNLLGLVKHVALVQGGYLGDVFGRPFAHPLAPADDDEPDTDLWVQAGQTRADVLDLARASDAHADATVAALGLGTRGAVPWWPAERNPVTLHQVLVHLVIEVSRHAGHADVLRELLDGTAGQRPGDPNLVVRPDPEATAHLRRIEQAARDA